MEQLKEAIMLRGYGQVNPLQAYTIEGYELFDELENKINGSIAQFLLKASIEATGERKQVNKEGKTNRDKGITIQSKKIGRNELCPCGSGKKYKQCCGK